MPDTIQAIEEKTSNIIKFSNNEIMEIQPSEVDAFLNHSKIIQKTASSELYENEQKLLNLMFFNAKKYDFLNSNLSEQKFCEIDLKQKHFANLQQTILKDQKFENNNETLCLWKKSKVEILKKLILMANFSQLKNQISEKLFQEKTQVSL